MEDLIKNVLEDKILRFADFVLPPLTVRDVGIADNMPGKAKVVLGMRRSGKTSLLFQTIAAMEQSGIRREAICYLNFEDERLVQMRGEHLSLIDEIVATHYPGLGRKYYFFDEIQNIDGWERYVRRRMDEGDAEFFLTGSSSKLLSRELHTAMRGRSWRIEIAPFSFAEYLRHNGVPNQAKTLAQRNALDGHLHRYMERGGLPDAQMLRDDQLNQHIRDHVDVLIYRDIIERMRVSNPRALHAFTRRLLSQSACLFSVKKIYDDLKSQGIQVSKETLFDFLGYLEDTYLLKCLPIHTSSEKQRQVNPRKIYAADTAIAKVFELTAKKNSGHLLETVVFNHLSSRSVELAYVKNADSEVDFRVRSADGTVRFVQVCYDLSDRLTLERECRALLEVKQPGAKIIVVPNNSLHHKSPSESITILSATDLLLGDEF